MSRGIRTIASPGVAITFDDGPHPEVTPLILETLAKARARATFFVVGTAALENSSLIREIRDEGHALGNHTQTHRNFLLVPPRITREEIERCQETIEAVAHVTPRVFRAPWGKLTRPAQWACRDLGLVAYDWTLAPEGWPQPWDVEDMVRVTLDRVRPGTIIDLHDVPWHSQAGFRTAAALPTILRGLAERGLETVLLSETPHPAPIGEEPPEAAIADGRAAG